MSDQLLRRWYNAFDPLLPADDSQYADTFIARGDFHFAESLRRRLIRSDRSVHYLFSGHIGGGKSSELKHTAKVLRGAESDRFFPIYLDASQYLDSNDAKPVDLLLAIVTRVGETLFEDAETLRDLSDSKVEHSVKNLVGILRELRIEAVEFDFKLAKFKLAPTVVDREARLRVREALQPRLTSVLEAVNETLAEARSWVRSRQFKDIVLLIDSLDKVLRVPDKSEGLASYQAFFVTEAATLTGIEAHKVITVPLVLVRTEGMALRMLYGEPPHVLPLIKVRNRDGSVYSPGYDALRRLVEQRLGPRHRTDELLTDEALEYLSRYSGGHPRSFLIFVQQSLDFVETIPFGAETARKGLRSTNASLNIHPTWWKKLAELERSEDKQIDQDDSDTQRMLDQLLIMEYRNGQGLEGFDHDKPWFAVNPLVTGFSEFQREIQGDAGTG
ncbi:hypothetical protein BH11ARM2_BH11ARM2_09710 [soil metagenome]